MNILKTLAIAMAAGLCVTAAEAQRTEVQPLNKASSLIGSEIRLQDNQQGGRVRDVVIDFDTGRVAYILVDAGEVLDRQAGGNLVAVPAKAFHIEDNQLRLKADRSKLQQARKFTSEKLPSISRPRVQRSEQAWGQSGAAFDESEFAPAGASEDDGLVYTYQAPVEARREGGDRSRRESGPYGAYGQSEYGQEGQRFQQSQRTERDRRSAGRGGSDRRSGQYEYDNYTYDYEFDSQRNERQKRASSEKTRSITGTISELDRHNQTVTVENWAGHHWKFRLPRDAKLQAGRSGPVGLSQLQEGQEVKVDFGFENGEWTAYSIRREGQEDERVAQ